MRRLLLGAVGAAVAGLVVGVLCVGAADRWLDRADWRAREITGWCNHYRVLARVHRDRLPPLVTALSSAYSDDPHADRSEADSIVASELARIHRDILVDHAPWFQRCASQPLPGVPDGVPMRAGTRALIAYLDLVLARVPVRDVDDPDDYVRPGHYARASLYW